MDMVIGQGKGKGWLIMGLVLRLGKQLLGIRGFLLPEEDNGREVVGRFRMGTGVTKGMEGVPRRREAIVSRAVGMLVVNRAKNKVKLGAARRRAVRVL